MDDDLSLFKITFRKSSLFLMSYNLKGKPFGRLAVWPLVIPLEEEDKQESTNNNNPIFYNPQEESTWPQKHPS